MHKQLYKAWHSLLTMLMTRQAVYTAPDPTRNIISVTIMHGECLPADF